MQKNEEYFDKLEQEYLELWPGTKDPTGLDITEFADDPHRPFIVAEGDSWFDYGWGPIRIGRDIVHQLKSKFDHRVQNVARAGDTLENMVYGTDVNRNFVLKRSQWWETKAKLEEFKPDIFLFSGGGNDFSGAALAKKLNHRLSNREPIRRGVVEYIFGEVVRSTFEDLFRQVWAVDNRIHIILHGYGVPRPNGRGVRRVGFRWSGPWLLPYLAKKGITDGTTAQSVMQELVGMFNEVLRDVAAHHEKVRFLDLREMIEMRDWENELHLSDEAFLRVAAEFDQTIREVRSSRE